MPAAINTDIIVAVAIMISHPDRRAFSSRLSRYNRLRPDAETFPDMFAVDGVFEYPFAPLGLHTPMVGRAAITANFQVIRKLLRVDGVADVSEIEASDPDVVVLEFTGRGEGVTTKEAYDQRYISVIRLRNGDIVHYKDYWNPIAFLQAVKGSGTTRGLTMG